MKIENKISAFKKLDYVPVVSTITNAIHLIQKRRFQKCQLAAGEVKYRNYVLNKRKAECILLLIPLFGNLIVAVKRLVKISQRSPHDKLLKFATSGEVEKFKAQIGTIEDKAQKSNLERELFKSLIQLSKFEELHAYLGEDEKFFETYFETADRLGTEHNYIAFREYCKNRSEDLPDKVNSFMDKRILRQALQDPNFEPLASSYKRLYGEAWGLHLALKFIEVGALNGAMEVLQSVPVPENFDAASSDLNSKVYVKFLAKWFEQNPRSEISCPLLSNLDSHEIRINFLINAMSAVESNQAAEPYLCEMVKLEFQQRFMIEGYDSLGEQQKLQFLDLCRHFAEYHANDIFNYLKEGKDAEARTSFDAKVKGFEGAVLQLSHAELDPAVNLISLKNSFEDHLFNGRFARAVYLAEQIRAQNHVEGEKAFRDLAVKYIGVGRLDKAEKVMAFGRVTFAPYVRYIDINKAVDLAEKGKFEEAKQLHGFQLNADANSVDFIGMARILSYWFQADSYKNMTHYSNVLEILSCDSIPIRHALLLHIAKEYLDSEKERECEQMLSFLVQSVIEVEFNSSAPSANLSNNGEYVAATQSIAKWLLRKHRAFMEKDLDIYFKDSNDKLLEILSDIMDNLKVFEKYFA